MKTWLYFFNYDMTVSVKNKRIAPEGFYSQSIALNPKTNEDEIHLYYKGIRDNTEVKIKDMIYKKSWELTDNEEVFRY